jgi:hypothetical protein
MTKHNALLIIRVLGDKKNLDLDQINEIQEGKLATHNLLATIQEKESKNL